MSISSWNPNPKEKYVLHFSCFYTDDLLQDETVVTLSIMRMTVQDAVNPFPCPVLSLAAPRSLVIYLLC